MSVSLITFATEEYYYSRYTLIKSAQKYGIDNIYTYSKSDFSKTPFYEKNIHITHLKRGAGFWLWKPYYILKHLEESKENDILVYCDSGVDIIGSLNPLINIAKQSIAGIVLFENYQGSGYFNCTNNLEVNEYNLYVEINKCKYWTKRDAYVLMGLDSLEYWDAPQVDACFQIFIKTNISIQFVKDWLMYCCNEQILTDLSNSCGKPNFGNFFGHIHDQAIISLLAKKNHLELFRSPSQFGNHYKVQEFQENDEYKMLPYSSSPKLNSKYPTILSHHRTRYINVFARIRFQLGIEKRVFKGWINNILR